MKPQFIGQKKIKFVKDSGEKTSGGTSIMEVCYQDDTVERFSSIMLEKISDIKPCDATELRKKRIEPVVKIVLLILQEWGIKTGELSYFSALLNQSLDYNSNQALLKLLKDWIPNPLSLDDIDLIAVDRILRKKT